ncbi:hypothetical protein HK105_202404 [Polyrhizophydium stewartii]|uniref:Peptidase M14 domain-containing protein n=1 Tax=Polyrhizophydium stewartii TaxID=2732419 RepID=A0ABR4NEN3_9FUNG
MKISSLWLAALALASSALAAPITESASPVSYKDHQVIRFTVATEQQAAQLRAIVSRHDDGISAWTDIHAGAAADLLVPPTAASKIAGALAAIEHKVLVSDLQANIDAERAHSEQNSHKLTEALKSGALAAPTAATVFSDYQDQATYESFIASLPGVTKQSIGTTYQGRSINAFSFGTGSKRIVFNGGIHAREWISPAVVTYVANYLTGSTSDAVALRSKFTFTVIPVLNPDGYAYTRSTDRLWRKNREPNSGSSCVGTDPNRNFPYKWGGEGASTSKCAEDYRGTAALSTKEAQALTSFIKSLSNVVSYIDFHSYSQLWMYPWGYDCNARLPEPELTDLKTGGSKAVAALEAVNGVSFTNGQSCLVTYPAAGATDDWTYSIGVKYTYSVELRDTGDNGFTLPASQIVPSGKEVVAAVVALWQYVATKV